MVVGPRVSGQCCGPCLAFVGVVFSPTSSHQDCVPAERI